MNATSVYSLLQDACHALDAAQEHAIAAHVCFAMALILEKYEIDPSLADVALGD